MNEIIKIKIHSMVDVITNSSTVIYTYQDSTKQAKELVMEVLKLQGITDKTADDIFYYGVFCGDDIYFEKMEYNEIDTPEDFPDGDFEYNTPEWNTLVEDQYKWLADLKMSIMKDGVEKPKWMSDIEDGGDYWGPDTILNLIPKDEKYNELGKRMQSLLNSIDADGGRDG